MKEKRLCDEPKICVHRRLGKVLLLALFLAGVFEAVWRKSAHLEQDQWTRTALRSHNGRLIILRLLT